MANATEICVARSGDTVTRACDASKDDLYACFDCGGRLTIRREHTRERSVCGVSMRSDVKAHFMHVGVRPASCSPESCAHKAAKLLVSRCPVRMVFKCPGCQGQFQVAYKGHPEAQAVEECSFASFKLDVGFVYQGRVVGAVEIYKTHRISDEKATALTTEGLCWAEVCADDVLQAQQVGREVTEWPHVEAIRCGVDLCDQCAVAMSARALDHERARLAVLSRTEAEERVRQLRSSILYETALDSIEQRIAEDRARETATIEVEVAESLIAAIRSRLPARRPGSDTLQSELACVLVPNPNAIRWGRAYYWMDPETIARQNPFYFVRVLCCIGHSGGHSNSASRTREMGETSTPPTPVVEAAREVRRRLRMCADCFRQDSVEADTCLTCMACVRRQLRAEQRSSSMW
jgi:hypothetical protein